MAFIFTRSNNTGETSLQHQSPAAAEPGSRLQTQAHLIVTNNFQEVRTHAVHFVNERQCAELYICLPDAIRFQTVAEHHQLRSKPLHAPSRTRMERSTSIVKSTCPGVSMMFTRCGSYMDLAIPDQNAGSCSGSDGDTTFLLLLHPVHRRSAVVHFANLVIDAGVEQDALVVVVFPASICAEMPMLRYRSMGVLRATMVIP